MEHETTKTMLASGVKLYAALLSAVASLITSVGPLFGKEGLVKVMELPDDVSAIARALATLVALISSLAIFLALGNKSRVKRIWLLASMVVIVAITTTTGFLVLQTSESGFPTVGSISPSISAMLLYVVAIVSWAMSFALLGIIFLRGAEARPSISELPEEIKKPEKDVGSQEIDSATYLYYLAATADWEVISKRVESGSHNGIWKVYGLLANAILSEQLGKRRKILRRARFWRRVRFIIRMLRPSSWFDNASHEYHLLNIANLMIEIKLTCDDLAFKRSKLKGDQKSLEEMYKNMVKEFLNTMQLPYQYGLYRIYDDLKQLFKQAHNLYPKLENRNIMALNVLTNNWMIPYETLQKSVPEVDQKLDLLGAETYKHFMTGEFDKIGSSAMQVAKQFENTYHKMPKGSIPKATAYVAMMMTYSEAAAASETTDPYNKKKYCNAIDALISIAAQLYQEKEVENLENKRAEQCDNPE